MYILVFSDRQCIGQIFIPEKNEQLIKDNWNIICALTRPKSKARQGRDFIVLAKKKGE